MARLTIDSGPVTDSHALRDVPKDKWFELMQVRRRFLRTNLAYDCRCLLQFVEDAEQMYQPLGFRSPEDFISRGLELDSQGVAWAVDGLQRLKPNEAIPYEKAKELGKQGRPKWIGQVGSGKGSQRTIKRGWNTEYLTAKLEKEGHHGLAEKVRTRTMSARAAGIAAGIITPPTPLNRLRTAWKVASKSERAKFLKEVSKCK